MAEQLRKLVGAVRRLDLLIGLTVVLVAVMVWTLITVLAIRHDIAVFISKHDTGLGAMTFELLVKLCL